MDALNITKDLASGSYKAVYVPNEKDVEIKEYIWMVHDMKKALKSQTFYSKICIQIDDIMLDLICWLTH